MKCDFGEDGTDKPEFTVFEFGADNAPGECVFVPRQGAKAEDDGYLATFVYQEKTDSSEFWVIDATRLDDPEKVVVAKVALPRRVPYGYAN